MADYISNKTIEKLKHDLVRSKLISFEDLTRAEELAKTNLLNLSHVLTEENLISEETLLKFLQNNLRIPYVNLEDYSIDEKCLGFISAEDAKKFKIIPLFKIENALTIAMADPLNLFAINNLVKCVQCQIEPVICSERLILEAVKKHYFPQEQQEGANFYWTEATGEESLIKSIIEKALFNKIFEIIIEVNNVKFKKPGSIKEAEIIPTLLAPLVVAHLKSKAGLDVSIFDVPQLGKFTYKDKTAILSTFPCTKGERLSIKLYNPPKTLKDLQLDIDLDKPGVILITGPELSGKSFVAYSILNSIDHSRKSIMTLESIAKYDLKGVTQCEMNESVGFNIEKALKFIEFQSPDIIYIEEIPSVDLLKITKAGKLVITEIKEAGITQELQSLANYIIQVKNIDEIRVIAGVK